MNRGEHVVSWVEPDTWRQGALAHAKKEGMAFFPWLTWIGVLGLVGGVIAWEWSDADPAARASVPSLIVIILTLWGFFIGVAWLHVRINRTVKTTLYTRGLVHGSLTRKQWIPWSEMEYFYIDEESVVEQKFRFLTWSRVGVDDEEFSVVPDESDLSVAVRCFKTNQVEQAEDGDPSQRPC